MKPTKVKVDNVNRADTAMLDIITTQMSEKQEIYKVSDELIVVIKCCIKCINNIQSHFLKYISATTVVFHSYATPS